MYLAFSVVFPMFFMMCIGYLLKILKIFNDDFLKQLNELCFKVFLPVLLFINVYKSNFSSSFSLKLVLFAVASIVLCFIFLMVFVPLIEKSNNRRGVIIQAIFRSNFIIFGIPVTVSLFSEGAASTTAVLIAFIIPLFNILSVIALVAFSTDKISLIKTIKQMAKNPLIIASIVAFSFVLFRISLGTLLEQTISDISKVTTPLALITLGGSFAFSTVKGNAKPLFICVFSKLILLPLVFMPIAILFGFRGIELIVLFALFASPTAVSSFTMAQSIGADSTLAGQNVVIGSILSVFSIFIGITVLLQLGFI